MKILISVIVALMFSMNVSANFCVREIMDEYLKEVGDNFSEEDFNKNFEEWERICNEPVVWEDDPYEGDYQLSLEILWNAYNLPYFKLSNLGDGLSIHDVIINRGRCKVVTRSENAVKRFLDYSDIIHFNHDCGRNIL